MIYPRAEKFNGVLWSTWAVALFVIFLITRLFWIGDVSFIYDEPRLLLAALNSTELFDFGLQGTQGVKYGPVGIWYFKFLLLFTKDVVNLFYLNGLIFSCALFWSASKILDLLDLKKQNLYFLIFSPFIWFYTRNLWDNNLNIIFSFAMLSFYLDFLKNKKIIKLFLTAILMSLMFQVHLMAIPQIAAVFFHFFIYNWNFVKNNWMKVLGIFFIVLVFTVPYLKALFLDSTSIGAKKFGTLKTFIFPLLGFQSYTTFDFSYFLGKKWQFDINSLSLRYIVIGTLGVTWSGYLIGFNGLKKIIHSLRKEIGLKKDVAFIVLFTLAFYMVMCLCLRIYKHPHYYNGISVIYFLLMSVGLSGAMEKIKKIYFPALALSLVSIMSFIHFNEGSKSLHYGATLKNQIAIAKSLNKYSKSTIIEKKTRHTVSFPEALEVLQKLYPQEVTKDAKSIQIIYANEKSNGAIRIVE